MPNETIAPSYDDVVKANVKVFESLASEYNETEPHFRPENRARVSSVLKQVLADAVAFQTGLQYTESNTRHFENGFRANTLVGGFYLSPTDGNLRIDATAAAVMGLLRYLNCGADRN